MHVLMSVVVGGQTFLGIPGKVTFDNKILDHIPMETQGDMTIDHVNT
jgi:hypothetical protein